MTIKMKPLFIVYVCSMEKIEEEPTYNINCSYMYTLALAKEKLANRYFHTISEHVMVLSRNTDYKFSNVHECMNEYSVIFTCLDKRITLQKIS